MEDTSQINDSQSIADYSMENDPRLNVSINYSETSEKFSTSEKDIIYDVLYDDYDYWLGNDKSMQESQNKTSFLSVKSMQPTSSLHEEGKCCICLSEKSNILLIPCRHLCCCKTCIQELTQKRCPICNNSYSDYVLTIIS
ncbi:putative inhibitor of apoptosis [Pseudomyrmex gracilis]|uniref:putative inhibitor of apoptosis n=1 Tax=Pseudomyrmex gracilis TaxID=219809 RepID=UPI0009954E96|nr:putative inhibitor of apoptosis [Pseudomyrmex gracilis]